MLKMLIWRLMSLFSGNPLIVGWDVTRRFTEAFVRGRYVRVRVIAGAAFEILEANLPAQGLSISTTYTQEVGAVPSVESQPNFQVGKVSLTSITAITGGGAAGATATLVVRKASVPAGGGAAVFVTVASQQFNAGINTVAEEEFNVPLSAVAGATTVVAGDVIDAQWVQGGTGLALPASVVKVELN